MGRTRHTGQRLAKCSIDLGRRSTSVAPDSVGRNKGLCLAAHGGENAVLIEPHAVLATTVFSVVEAGATNLSPTAVAAGNGCSLAGSRRLMSRDIGVLNTWGWRMPRGPCSRMRRVRPSWGRSLVSSDWWISGRLAVLLAMFLIMGRRRWQMAGWMCGRCGIAVGRAGGRRLLARRRRWALRCTWRRRLPCRGYLARVALVGEHSCVVSRKTTADGRIRLCCVI